MSKRRIRFSKQDMAKFISHLDLLRCFTRAIGRSGLPAVFTQGFNPHMKMTFALPLPVGVTSDCESVDITFEDGITDGEILQKLNDNLPPDIRITSVGEPRDKAADIVCAEYSVILKSDTPVSKTAIDAFFAMPEVTVMKKTKKKTEKPINIMDYIRAWEITDMCDDSVTLRLVLDAGGERNLKPDTLVSAFCKLNPDIVPENADINRTEIFCRAVGTGNETVIKKFE